MKNTRDSIRDRAAQVNQGGEMNKTIRLIPKFDKDDLDQEIRDIIIKLNSGGFITEGSCAGHRDCPLGHGDRGFICFELGYSNAAIIAALTWYGLKNITLEVRHYDDGGDSIFANFDPVGEPISDFWIRQVDYIAAHRGKN